MASISPTPSSWAHRGRPFRLKRRPDERVRVLGALMDLVRFEEVFHFVSERLSAGEKTIIANHNLHSLYLLRRDAKMRQFFDMAHLIEVDSMPLIFWARLMGRRSRKFHRCTYLDWREEFWSLAIERGWRVFFLGGAPGVAEAAQERLLTQWPTATLSVHTGYFDHQLGSDDNEALLKRLEAFQPDILFVGMGMPLQERWIVDHFDRLPTTAIFPVGGAFDYEAGIQVECPRILGQLGLEWLFRLCLDPKRLFFRYCVEPYYLFWLALRDIAHRLFGKPEPKLSWPADERERDRAWSAVNNSRAGSGP